MSRGFSFKLQKLSSSSKVILNGEPRAEFRVYGGSSGGLHSSTRNHVPVPMVEIP